MLFFFMMIGPALFFPPSDLIVIFLGRCFDLGGSRASSAIFISAKTLLYNSPYSFLFLPFPASFSHPPNLVIAGALLLSFFLLFFNSPLSCLFSLLPVKNRFRSPPFSPFYPLT